MTRTGELLGTPLYMAPEQLEGRRSDEQADQFSFCVALYQALYGAHPFPAARSHDLMAAVTAGAVLPAPPKTTVPAWLRRVLLRGLRVQPAARWPSMEALVAALERDPARGAAAARRGSPAGRCSPPRSPPARARGGSGTSARRFAPRVRQRMVGQWETAAARARAASRSVARSSRPACPTRAGELASARPACSIATRTRWAGHVPRRVRGDAPSRRAVGRGAGPAHDLPRPQRLTSMRALVDVLTTADHRGGIACDRRRQRAAGAGTLRRRQAAAQPCRAAA